MHFLTDTIEAALFRHIVLGQPWTQITDVRVAILADIPGGLEAGATNSPVFVSDPVTFVPSGAHARTLDSSVEVTVPPIRDTVASAVVLYGTTSDGTIPLVYGAVMPVDLWTLAGFTLVPGDITVRVGETLSEVYTDGIFSVMFDGAAGITTFATGDIHVGLSVGIPEEDLSSIFLIAPFTPVAHNIGGLGRNRAPIDFGVLDSALADRAFTHAAFLDGANPSTAKLLKYAPLRAPVMSHTGLHIIAPPNALKLRFV